MSKRDEIKKLPTVFVAILSVFGFAQAKATDLPRQFDLICERQAGGAEQRIRIDLDASQWCADSCADTAQLTATPDEIILRDDSLDTTPTHAKRISVDRRSGVLTITTRNFGMSLAEGITLSRQCSVAPYSGSSAKPLF